MAQACRRVGLCPALLKSMILERYKWHEYFCQSALVGGCTIVSLSLWLTACGGGGSPSLPETTTTQANPDSYELAIGQPGHIDAVHGVLSNDQGDALQVVQWESVTPIEQGTIEIAADGSLRYDLTRDQAFQAQLDYVAQGADGVRSQARITLQFYPAPTTQPDHYQLLATQRLDVAEEGGILENDHSVRGIVQVALVMPPQHAVEFALDEAGHFAYQPQADFTGTDTFSYRIDDGLQSSVAQMVTLEVASPLLQGQDDHFDVTRGQLLMLTAREGILANDSRTFALQVRPRRVPRHAKEFRLTEAGELIYRTVTEDATQDSFTYELLSQDKLYGPYEVTLTIKPPAADAAVADAWDQCLVVKESATIDGMLSGPAGARFELVTQPQKGRLVAFDETTGGFSYAPADPARRGEDHFSYRIYDAQQAWVADGTQQLLALPYRIMPVGDSITSGVEFYNGVQDTPDSSVRVGYRKFLKDELEAQGYRIDFVGTRSEGYAVPGFDDVQHNGYPGWSDAQVLGEIDAWLDADASEIILLHIGTNWTQDNLQNLSAILDHIAAAGNRVGQPITVMLAKLIQRSDDPALAAKILNFNQLIETEVVRRQDAGEPIFLVDQFSALGADGRYLSNDHLHPGAEGYRVMANTWAQRLIATQAIARCERR